MAEERPQGGSAAGAEGDRARLSRAHWRDNVRIMALLLCVWFAVSFLLGIVFVEPLNAVKIGGFLLGFWFAQQGAIYVFIVLILVYALWMDRVDRRHGVHDDQVVSPSSSRGGREEEGV